ncbi:MAG: hypothetical protein CVT90_01665 [Candidatus Altiarchaeales archaeon HGW-Altiarchaeales-3]|nr:MAG: hypothetical protein CVT90_01665 [Candidatus Altiarchaeales archaeon HGW-Altiarchaeales-3]
MEGKKILNEDLEKEIKERVNREVKAAHEMFDKNKKILVEKTDETAESIRKRPIMWVGGAFISGILLGKLLSRK